MNCELIAVGTELLLGEIANTDAQMISQGLSELGFNVYHHTVVGDNPARLRDALLLAKSRADIIITTGGLGPTCDDLTKETIAAAFGRGMYMDEAQLIRLRERMGPRMTPNNEKQAELPERSEVFVNDWGTAPGCAFCEDGCHVIMLPGPPRECEAMFKYRAVPYLEKLRGGVIRSRYIKVFGMGESEMESKLAFMMNTLKNPTAAPYAKEGECLVRVTAHAESEQEAYALCEPVVEQVCGILGDVVYGIDVSSLEEVVVKGLAQRGLTIAVAESCTGGMVAKRLTDIPGASRVFGCGCITYSNDMKEKMLGVPAEILAQHGAVSAETAMAMACGVRALSGADIGVSITGIAGPDGGSEEKPVGLVYIGLSTKDGERAFEQRRLRATRERVRLFASSSALDLVRKYCLND